MGQTRFEEGAATWDDQPARVLMGKAIAAGILEQVPLEKTMTVVDFGCGTGLVTLALLPYVRSITGIDNSVNMLEQLRMKCAARQITNVKAIHLNLEVDSPPDEKADAIVSAMAFHHVADLPRVVRSLVGMLVPGGFLAIADLDAEDGSFHENMDGVHHAGFERAWLKDQMRLLGLGDLKDRMAYVVERQKPEGPRHYPVFLVSGKKLSILPDSESDHE
jgi:trans-aconitate methyltransferase